MTRIAVDAGALGRGNGIARYLGALLPRMVEARGYEWRLFGRNARRLRAGPWHDRVDVRADGLPAGIGDLASLATSQSWWLARNPPDLFWGPAHRFPLRIPRQVASVVTIHDLCWLRAPATMRSSTRVLDRLLMPRALARADRIIAVSHATGEALREAFPALSPRIVVVHEACAPMPPPGSAEGLPVPYVLCVGTVEPRKNLPRLFEAFARTPPGVQLVLAGALGWGSESPQALAERAGIAGRFSYLGAVDDHALATLYRHAMLLAMPSLYEGFGLPLLEALVHGTPVLYGDNSSMREVAGDAGVGVEATSVDSIASGLTRLIADVDLRAGLASRAIAQAAKFSWDRAASETLAVFEAAIAARQPRSA